MTAWVLAHVQRSLSGAGIASGAGPARRPAEDFAGVVRSAAASFLRRLSQARALRSGREDRAGRRHLEGRIHRRHQQPGVAAHHSGAARHSGQRRAADAAPSSDQRSDARNRSRFARSLSDLDLRPDRHTDSGSANRQQRPGTGAGVANCPPGSCAPRRARSKNMWRPGI